MQGKPRAQAYFFSIGHFYLAQGHSSVPLFLQTFCSSPCFASFFFFLYFIQLTWCLVHIELHIFQYHTHTHTSLLSLYLWFLVLKVEKKALSITTDNNAHTTTHNNKYIVKDV